MKKYILIALLVLSCRSFAQQPINTTTVIHTLTAVPETTWVRCDCGEVWATYIAITNHSSDCYKCEKPVVKTYYQNDSLNLYLDKKSLVMILDTIWMPSYTLCNGTRVFIRERIDTVYMLSHDFSCYFRYFRFKIKR
jgi:hypothetical protein